MSYFNLHSIKSKLILSFFGLIGAALLFQFIYITPKFRKRKVEEIKISQDAFAGYLADEIGAKLDAAVKELEAMAALPGLAALDKPSMDNTIRTLNSSNQFFDYYFMMDKRGRWLSYPTRPELVGKKIPPENMDWVDETFKTGRTVFLDVVKSRIGTLVSGFSTPIRSKGGEIIALMRGVFTVSEKNTLIRAIENAGIIKGCQAYLVSSNGWLIAHSHQNLNYSRFNSYSLTDYEPVRQVLKRNKGIVSYPYHGKQWIAAFHPIRLTNWGLIVQQPLEDIISAANAEVRLITFVILGCFTIGLLMAALIVQLALRPLFRLVGNIQAGAVDIHMDYPKDEIGQLAFQYNVLYSDLHQSNELIQKSEQKFRTLFNNASDAIFIINLEGHFLEANQRAVDYTGYSYEELLKMTVADLNAPESTELVPSRIDELKQGKELLFEVEHVTKAGDIIPVEISSRVIEFDNQQGILSVVRDLTERKKVENALRESHNRFLTVLDGIDATIYAADMETHEVLFMNKHMIESFGRDMTGDVCWDVFRGESGPCSHCSNDRLVDEKGEPTGVYVWHDRNPITGKWYINYDRAIKWIDGRLVRIQIATDITKLKELEEEKLQFEEQLRQAQKMEALGTLSGGIAHDFNNLLMGIQGRASLMAMELDPSSPLREHIEAIEGYVRSATNLTKQLLGFARGGKYEVKPIDINELVLSTAAMFGRTRKEVRIHTQTEQVPPVVEADTRQIEQVLLNIFVNAWQAMPDGGDLYLETSIVQMDEASCKPHGIEQGLYGRISVTDTGIGMDEATRLRIFDPFFTTKEKGRGTGLGLASAYGIIKNHGGMIAVYSEVGQGTTFNIYLPISDRDVHREKRLQEGPIKGSETIFLVDDEEMIIEVARAMLEKLGYRVISADSGDKAVDVVRRNRENIDLIILDLIMPGMDGGKTFDRIRDIAPAMPVILSSGYAINGLATEILQRGCNGFIQKPFNASELSQKVRNVLGEAKGSRYGESSDN